MQLPSLLAKLLTSVRTALKIEIANMHAWSDSIIVHYWLDGSPRKFKTFVGNRVANIMELLPSAARKHVPSEHNPADCASWRMLPKDLISHELWWNGPDWLSVEPFQVPSQPLAPPPAADMEVKATCLQVSTSSHPELEASVSSFDKLLKITAWALQFIHNARARIAKHHLNISC